MRKSRLRKRVSKDWQAEVDPRGRIDTVIDVRDAALRLPPEMRQTILCALLGLTQAEIAAVTGLSRTTVQRRTKSALTELSSLLLSLK